MDIKASELYKEFEKHGLFKKMSGVDCNISGIAPVEKCGPGDLVFVKSSRYLQFLQKNQPAAVVIDSKVAENVDFNGQFTVLVSSNVDLAHALIKQRYMDRNLFDQGWPRIHPSAQIDESATIPDSVSVGPLAVIGRNVIIGERAYIGASAVIEEEAKIGDDVVVHPQVFVGYCCEIGKGSILKVGCVIGSEGFGFAQDSQRRNHRIPQTGRVVIGENAVIGSLNTIDRATYGETLIESGVVFDTHIHIGHNCRIGKDTIIISQSGISGSCNIGERVIMSGQCGVLDHVAVPDDTVLLHRAGVTKSLKQPGVYCYQPLMPLQQGLRVQSLLTRLQDFKDRLFNLEKKLVKSS